MNTHMPILLKSFFGIVAAAFLTTACSGPTALKPEPPAIQEAMTSEPQWVRQPMTLPTSVDYRAEGFFADQPRRSTFAYDAQNRLLYITDGQIGSADSWLVCKFEYTSRGLSSIIIPTNSIASDFAIYDQNVDKSARFELQYAGRTVQARLMLGNRELKTVAVALDERGFPVKTQLNGLFFQQNGNFDWLAYSQHQKTVFPNSNSEIIEQRYDTRKQVFTDLRELQLLEALLGIIRGRVSDSGLIGMGSSLNTNSLLSIKLRNCQTGVGCREVNQFENSILVVSEAGFPTRLRYSLGAFGYCTYNVTYKQVQ